MNLAAIATILETVISDAPSLVSVVGKLITIFKENREPTVEEWSAIESAVDAANAKLQKD